MSTEEDKKVVPVNSAQPASFAPVCYNFSNIYINISWCYTKQHFLHLIINIFITAQSLHSEITLISTLHIFFDILDIILYSMYFQLLLIVFITFKSVSICLFIQYNRLQ